jgi:hypothetical protein
MKNGIERRNIASNRETEGGEPSPESRRFHEAKQFFRDLLRGKEYVIFASTALRMNGEKYEDGEEGPLYMGEDPGDFDINFLSEKDFDEFVNILAKLEAAGDVDLDHGENGPVHISSLDGARIIRGSVHLSEGEPYPFEAFLNSSIVPSKEYQAHIIDGLHVLNAEGLNAQYAKNLELESRIQKYVEAIKQFIDSDDFSVLMSNKSISLEDGGEFSYQDFCEALDVTDEDIRAYLENEKTPDQLFAGLKTKIRKRRLDIDRLQKVLRPSG